MQIEVETLALAVEVHPEADNKVDELEQDQRDNRVIRDGAADAVELDEHLLRVAVDQTALTVAADRRHREDAGQEGSDRAADAMHAKGIKAVVVTEGVLEAG